MLEWQFFNYKYLSVIQHTVWKLARGSRRVLCVRCLGCEFQFFGRDAMLRHVQPKYNICDSITNLTYNWLIILFCLALKKVANGHMWTSGTNQGVFSEANFGWCSTGYLVPDNMWVSYEGPYDPWARRCVTIRLIKGSPMDSRLENAPCGVKLNSVVCRIPDWVYFHFVKIH